ncbi:MAG TPA: molecular chaperone GroEL [Candidatus Acidoferrales bacterium]|nr:molecular chaperone GroEL [Candidatus Acidoferrales bacterium]
MGKRVQFDDAARQALWRGVDQLANAVRITLGPRGRSVVFDRLHGVPAITRDGIAVAQEIELPDRFENLGVQMLREAAFRTGQVAGDGTSTATVIAHRLIGDGLRAVASGHHPQGVRRGIERAVSAVTRELAAQARPVGDARDLERIAVIAAGDRSLGELVAHALGRVGHDGVVTVEEGRGLDTTLDVVEGTRFEGGYVSPYFITDAEDMEASFDHPLVALIDGPLDRPGDVIPALEHASRLSRPVVWLCERVGGEALAVLVVNRLRGTAPSVAVAMPGPAARRRELLDDVALLTGGEVVGRDAGRAAERFEPVWFGRARRAIVTSDQTTLVQGGGRGEALAAATVALRREHAHTATTAERDALRVRLARLAGGVAAIRVGAASEFERHARRSRLEDALAATRSAMEEGVVAGGGVALLRASGAVRALSASRAEQPGRDAVLAALVEPARQIGVNAGEEGGRLIERLRQGSGAFGFNARSCRYGDLAAEGVLDPAKVTRCALQNAASVAALVLTTDALVVDDDPPTPPPGEGA